MNLSDTRQTLDEQFEQVYGAYQRGKMDAIAGMPPHRLFIYSYYADEYEKGYNVGLKTVHRRHVMEDRLSSFGDSP